jgi:uncharacterized iron-regulated protein
MEHPPHIHRRFGLTTVLFALVIGGCATNQPNAPTGRGALRHTLEQPPQLTIQRGTDATVMDWNTLIDHAVDADVVILGEQHNDAIGHAVQLAIVEAVTARTRRAAVAFEMLECDEQPLLDDYRDGLIDAETFAKLTNSQTWAGKGSWEAWYQPVIDAGLNNDAALIAANAPRRYVRAVRTKGFDALNKLDRTRAAFVKIPKPRITGDYRDRFMELMSGHGDDVDPGVQESFFRSQQIWDATMADSVLKALRMGRRPVLLLVGRFHSDREGGTVRCITRARPNAKVLVISLEPNRSPGEPETFNDGDQASAQHNDVIVFTAPK